MQQETRIPKQKRSLAKYEKIIDTGWKLISKNGYHNTNTAEIAKEANVSTGIVYQYFKDKHEILIEGIKKYGDEVFYPMIKINNNKEVKSIEDFFRKVIKEYINDHKISKDTHEEIMSMVHNDNEIREYYYKREMELTNYIYDLLIYNNIKKEQLKEKVHIIIGMIDNLCHEVVYHKHKELDYETMTNLVINNINKLLN
jgi:hypothetical protein